MKRIIYILLATVLLTALWGTAGAEDDRALLLEELERLLDAREALYRIQSGVLDAAEAFLQRNDYDTLIRVRVLCGQDAAESFPESDPLCNLPDAALLSLMLSGVETNALEIELWETQYIASSTWQMISLFRALTYGSVYQNSELAIMRRRVDLYRQQLALYCLYDCNFVNYLLLPVADDPAVPAFWNSIPERWPIIAAAQPAWNSDQEAVSESTEEVVEELSVLLSGSSSVLGQNHYAFDQFAASIANADLLALLADFNPIGGRQKVLPLPESWMLNDDIMLLAYGETGADGLPNTMVLFDLGIALSDFIDYADWLISLGAEEYDRSVRQDGSYFISLIFNSDVITLYWSAEGTVMFMFDPRLITFEPLLYCTLSLMAEQ